MTTDVPKNSSKSFWKYWLGTVIASTLLAFAVVLPAEYGFDPLGSGSFLGISGMSASAALVSDSADKQRPLTRHKTTFSLQPFESLELKYQMDEGEFLLYSWHSSDSELLYELHSEPPDAEPGYADSYERARTLARSGAYQAEYKGIHGWFWENRETDPTTVTVITTGFFSKVILYRDGSKSELSMSEDVVLY